MRARILLLMGLFTPPVFTASSTPNLAHISVYFGASHFDHSMIRGRFDETDGVISLDKAIHQDGFDFTVDADSISTRLRVLGGMLKSEWSLGAAKSPVTRLCNDHFVVKGGRLIAIKTDLTLHGVMQSTRLEVRRLSCGDEKMPGNTRHVCGGDFHFAIIRSTFGMTCLLPDVDDRVDLDISVETTPQ